MKTVFIISSQVAASRVGASAGVFCLQRLGVNTVVLPTVLLGRHPGWGAPGGGAVEVARLADMWTHIKAHDVRIDAILTGYMASPEQVSLAETIIEDVRAANPKAVTIVDPVMGDNGALYIRPEIAVSIIETLIPLADYITPNLWELGHITRRDVTTIEMIMAAGQSLQSRLICTSVRYQDKIGSLLVSERRGWFAGHEEFPSVPHGGGDAFAATFLAHLIRGAPQADALARSAASIFEILKAAHKDKSKELPLIEAQGQLLSARPLSLLDFEL